MRSINRFLSPPDTHFFLFGPRGTGKSTWLKTTFPDAMWIDLLELDQAAKYHATPWALKEVALAQPAGTTIILDEIQKVPALLDVVHALIENEKERGYRFIATGSSARKLKRDGANLLAGRLLLRSMHPFMAAELGDAFDLEKSLRLGLLPLVLGSARPEETLRSYAGMYLKEEVQTEALVRNIGGFSRFMQSASFSHGQVLNTSAMARECMVSRPVAEAWLQVLEDLLLAWRIPVFSLKAKRKLASHSKLYFFDSGVFQSLRPRGPLDSTTEIGGAALEGLVAQHLKAWCDAGGGGLHFWRTSSGAEVDFVVYGEKEFSAIEVKASRQVHHKDLRHLKAFRQDYPAAKACLVYGGEARALVDGIRCIPALEFLLGLKPGQPIL